MEPESLTNATAGADAEHANSLTLFLALAVTGVCLLVTHALIRWRLAYLPESAAAVAVGAAVGLVLRLLGVDWRRQEAFPPTVFFLVLLPPIIFESGYNLRKGNFFRNIGSILTFAIVGTAISAAAVGFGLYGVGQAGWAYQLPLFECLAFGSLISAVDPVATLAIFQALKVDQVLYMLVFGESILNDAISIVLMTTALELSGDDSVDGAQALALAASSFAKNFLGAAAIGVAFALASALLLKFVDLSGTPSLEIGAMLIFGYAPYCLAEAARLSGIMSILFAGIVMSHYSHRNLSPVTQITVQHTFRTLSFLAETLVFAYLGLAIFSFELQLEPSFVAFSILLTLAGRACNIFPLSLLLNCGRGRRISAKTQFVMWFSGLRGAIAFALALQLQIDAERRRVVVTSTLAVVLFTVLLLGGGTMPLIRCLERPPACLRRLAEPDDADWRPAASLSKTQSFAEVVGAEASASHGHSRESADGVPDALTGLALLDSMYVTPALTRAFTPTQVVAGHQHVQRLTDQWHHEVRCPQLQRRQCEVAEAGRVEFSRGGADKPLLLSADTGGGETAPLLMHN